jgi:hypothetical protein
MASRPPEGGPSGDPARSRWIIIQAMRLLGVAMIVVGILLTQGKLDLAGDSNELLGYLLVVIGLVDGFVMPQVLARKWRTPPA